MPSSTRGMTGIRIGGKLMGTYNHFDSYPDVLGNDMVEFVKNFLDTPAKVEDFKVKVLALTVITYRKLGNEWVEDKPTLEDINYYMTLPTPEGEDDLRTQIGGIDRAKVEWYALLRNYQGTAGLEAIVSGELKHWCDGVDFLKDSLFCEYAYVLDLDRCALDCYEGFQQGKGMVTVTREDGTSYQTEKWNPCKKVGAVPFQGITLNSVMACYPNGEQSSMVNPVAMGSIASQDPSPVPDAAEASGGEERSQPHAQSANSGCNKILIVDDEPEFKNLLVEALNGMGYPAEGAESGEVAIQMAKAQHYAIIFTDSDMPGGLSGLDLIEAITEIAPKSFCILMNDFPLRESRIQAFKHGAYDFIQKPFKLAELDACLARSLNHYNSLRKNEAYQIRLQEIANASHVKFRINGLSELAAINAMIGTLETLACNFEAQVKKESLDILVKEALRTGDKPEILNLLDDMATGQYEMRKRSSASALTEDEIGICKAYDIPTVENVKVEERYVFNPEALADQKMMEKIAEALTRIPELAGRYIIQRQEAVKTTVMANGAIEVACALKSRDHMVAALGVAGVQAVKTYFNSEKWKDALEVLAKAGIKLMPDETSGV